MEYFAMLALIIVLATGYIIVASKAADHSDKGNKKQPPSLGTDGYFLNHSWATAYCGAFLHYYYTQRLLVCQAHFYSLTKFDEGDRIISVPGKTVGGCSSTEEVMTMTVTLSEMLAVLTLLVDVIALCYIMFSKTK